MEMRTGPAFARGRTMEATPIPCAAFVIRSYVASSRGVHEWRGDGRSSVITDLPHKEVTLPPAARLLRVSVDDASLRSAARVSARAPLPLTFPVRNATAAAALPDGRLGGRAAAQFSLAAF